MLGFNQRRKAREELHEAQREVLLSATSAGCYWNGQWREKGDSELVISVIVKQGVPFQATLKETQFVLEVPSMGVEPKIITRGSLDAQAVVALLTDA